MNGAELIGMVVALYLREQLSTSDREGTARFIIDNLTPEQTAATVRAILSDSSLSAAVDVKMPARFLEGQGLPDSVLTDKRATYFRNSECQRAALLLANTGDDEKQSLKELVSIGAAELQEHGDLWIQAVTTGLALPEEQKKWWEKALRGLQELRIFSLERVAEYVLQTRDAITNDGQSLMRALGIALPALHIPRDSAYFNALNEKVRTHISQWKRLYTNAYSKRADYLRKQTPSQSRLTTDDLKKEFERVKESIPETYHAIVRAFIEAPGGWNDAAAALASCEWEDVKPLFDGLKRERYNLGAETIEFYREREPKLLSVSDHDYLRRLIARKTTEADEEDKEFYEAHRNELKEDAKLKSRWDRFVYGSPQETDNIILGLALCMEALFNQQEVNRKRTLTIRCERSLRKDLRDLNVDVGLYFAARYRGLQSLLGPNVRWEVGQLFEFEEVVKEWKSKGTKLNHSSARDALQLKFVLSMEVDLVKGGTDSYYAQLVWKFKPNEVISEFVSDWSRLRNHPLVYCRVSRKAQGSKGQVQMVDLSNAQSLMPVYGQNSGSFVAAYKAVNDITLTWWKNIGLAEQEHLITASTAQVLRSSFDAFRESYASAIKGFYNEGLGAPDLEAQLQKYSTLLHLLCVEAKGDRNRELLLRPLLNIGTVVVEGGHETAIVTPWHPLRLAAMARKARLITKLIKILLALEQVQFGDPHLFFKDLHQELKHPFYPEVVLGWHGDKPCLLAYTDVVGDYTLHESPIAKDDGLDDTNENPTQAANKVLDLVRRYLSLYPHKKANLSVVLYNCDSARLPQAVVDKIGTIYEDEEDVRCQVILRHRDSQQLRALYEQIIGSLDADPDSFNASEATQDFMARLRIAIMIDQAPPPNPKDGCFADIAFSQDVIARHARIEWYSETANPVALESLIPPRWSRRRPAAKDDMKSVVYLCCPVQSREGWTFLTALTTFLKGDWDGNEERQLLPARQLDFKDPSMASIFRETHDLATWVVNYDELLDRRQLLNQNVQVIRYKQSATQGKNVIISSTASLDLLRQMVLNRIKDLSLGFDETTYQNLANRFIQDANGISGDIVLRAAKNGRNASELMGVVLSRFLISQELGTNRYYGWYFLDDYAEWLGQREEQIADILTLSPEQTPSGQLRLTIIVAESKYIDVASLASKRKESQKQLRDTVKRITDALFGDPERLDRDLWLARLSDLILDGIQIPASAGINLADWRRAIREGTCEVYVRGYSHVFISGPSDATAYSDFVQVAGLDNSYQEIFSRADVRRLVLSYLHDQNPMSMREEIAGESVWDQQIYQSPTDRKFALLADETGEASDHDSSGNAQSPHSSYTFQSSWEKDNNSLSTPTLQIEQTSDSALTAETGAVQENGKRWAYTSIDALLINDRKAEEDGTQEQAWLRDIESRTKAALQQFQMRSKLLNSILTPNAALLKFAGSDDLTVELMNKRRSQFLTTYSLNIISVQPEPGAVALSIERPKRQIIKIQDLWKQWTPDSAHGNQDLLIGVKEADGELLLLSPGSQHAPHTLIAGSTGSGKSVLLQNIILAIAATNTPKQARLILIDPKQGVDYFNFISLPHLDGGEIIDQREVAMERLNTLVEEMDARYAKFKIARAPNLRAYNQKVKESEQLPVLWLIHDEFAEWMLIPEYKQEISNVVSRLGVKARAAGIYLVFAAQRPDANVMPMQLRANLGNRLILRVDSEGTSEVALGEKGAERLLGRGHLLAKLEGFPLYYAQVPLVEEEFTEKLISAII